MSILARPRPRSAITSAILEALSYRAKSFLHTHPEAYRHYTWVYDQVLKELDLDEDNVAIPEDKAA